MTTRSYLSPTNSPSTANSVSGGLFDAEIIEERPGLLVFRVSGAEADRTFENEAGGHRWQRIPPTERNGRVQTSTVTVAVLQEPTETQVVIRDGDLEWSICRGSGAGGQHRNVTDSAVQLRHKPSGLVVRCESERSQHRNKASALSVLRSRLWAMENSRRLGAVAENRKRQVGSGMRGDKRRTIRVRDGAVNDHITGRKWRYADYVAGKW